MKKNVRFFTVVWVMMLGAVCHGQLSTKGEGDFSMEDHIVSASFFHWYTSEEGQKVGPWLPLEGRENWTGSVDWWKGQIRQVMRSNIDVLYVHLIERLEEQRVNLFESLSELRAEGYDVPKIAPFLDPMIIWLGEVVDLSTAEGRQELVSHYIRFYEQYFSVNTDDFAESYIAKIDGRPILVTWHLEMNASHLDTYRREFIESALADQFSDRCPAFTNGIYMVTTGVSQNTFRFADEKAFLYELHTYQAQKEHNGIVTAMVKPGYWDQNVRNPGFCLPRAGGANYRSAWEQALSSPAVQRVYIESWNEYDEGSGIYSGNPDGTYIHPDMGNESSDTWSASNDPFEYIKTTAEGARRFNDTPDYDAAILTHDVPSVMQAGKEYKFNITVRNEGDVLWSKGAEITLSLKGMMSRAHSEAMKITKENLEYGGIYRGCPVSFQITTTAPDNPGLHEIEIEMVHGGKGFGEKTKFEVKVE